MRLRSTLAAVALAAAASVRAEEPVPNILPPPPPPAVAVEAPPTATGVWFDGAGSPEPLFGMDLMLGQQIGIRANVGVWRGPASSVVVEGFYGALLTKLGQSEGAGGGLRWLFTRASRSGCDAVVVGP